MAEKTNQLPIDANQDIPRLIIRGEETITTSTSTGTWVTGSKVITVDQILSDAKPAIDVLILDNQDSKVYRSPMLSTTSGGVDSINLNHTMKRATSGGNTVIELTINVKKNSGSATDTYTAYYVVYTTKMSDDITI